MTGNQDPGEYMWQERDGGYLMLEARRARERGTHHGKMETDTVPVPPSSGTDGKELQDGLRLRDYENTSCENGSEVQDLCKIETAGKGTLPESVPEVEAPGAAILHEPSSDAMPIVGLTPAAISADLVLFPGVPYTDVTRMATASTGIRCPSREEALSLLTPTAQHSAFGVEHEPRKSEGESENIRKVVMKDTEINMRCEGQHREHSDDDIERDQIVAASSAATPGSTNRLLGEDGKNPTWADTAMQIWTELDGDARPVQVEQAQAYAQEHWERLCWSQSPQSPNQRRWHSLWMAVKRNVKKGLFIENPEATGGSFLMIRDDNRSGLRQVCSRKLPQGPAQCASKRAQRASKRVVEKSKSGTKDPPPVASQRLKRKRGTAQDLPTVASQQLKKLKRGQIEDLPTVGTRKHGNCVPQWCR